jgi:hypothetical protein
MRGATHPPSNQARIPLVSSPPTHARTHAPPSAPCQHQTESRSSGLTGCEEAAPAKVWGTCVFFGSNELRLRRRWPPSPSPPPRPSRCPACTSCACVCMGGCIYVCVRAPQKSAHSRALIPTKLPNDANSPPNGSEKTKSRGGARKLGPTSYRCRARLNPKPLLCQLNLTTSTVSARVSKKDVCQWFACLFVCDRRRDRENVVVLGLEN